MSYNYDSGLFSSTDDNQSDDETLPYDIRRWKIGTHAVPADVDADALYEAAAENESINSDIAAALQTAADKVSAIDISDYQCPVCGLSHSHGVNDQRGEGAKHDIRDDPINVRDSFAESMMYNPVCHCGINELSMLLDIYPHFAVSVFEDDHKFEALLQADTDAVVTVLELASHPNITVKPSDAEAVAPENRLNQGDLRDAADDDSGYVVAEQKTANVVVLLDAFDIDYTDDIEDAFFDLRERYDHIRSAADQAGIPNKTEEAIEETRSELHDEFLN